jgi:hypothetical protein
VSVTAGRTYLAVACTLFVSCLVWFGIAWSALGPWSGATVVPAVLGLVAGIGLGAGALIFSRFVEASLDGSLITVRYVLRPRRSVSAAEIDEVVLLRALHLPARAGASSVPRIVLRRGGRTVIAFTPRDVGVVRSLAALGCEPVVVSEPLTPLQASRRYGRAAGFGEMIGEPLVWAAILVPLAVVVWAVWDAAGG